MIKNFDFLITFQKLQMGVEYDELIKFLYAMLAFTKSNPSPFQNYALINKVPNSKELKIIEDKFNSLNRTPAFYFENNEKFLADLKDKVGDSYRIKWEDSWMFFDNREIDKSRFGQVEKVSYEVDLEIFLSTFDACYQKNDPQNPYGEVKDYIINCRRAWNKFKGTDRLQYFLVYEDERPVATSILNNFEGLGYISAVGSLKEVRGKGYGKLATLYAVFQSQKLGNKEQVLATEERTYPNEFYKRIGFETRFTALGYTKM